MERKIILTRDGSHSISIPEMNVTYHSIHGAIQESRHVFIEAGLHGSGPRIIQGPEPCKIMEVGFGTGLNALLTAIEAEKTGTSIYYVALEPYPLSNEEIHSLNYCQQLGRPDLQKSFERIHNCEWEKEIQLTTSFSLNKRKVDLLDPQLLKLVKPLEPFELIFFDAFAPSAQPELWTKEVFEKLYSMLTSGGILVTYCSKSIVRKAMQAGGFTVEKIPGPWGKREMIRARKQC